MPAVGAFDGDTSGLDPSLIKLVLGLTLFATNIHKYHPLGSVLIYHAGGTCAHGQTDFNIKVRNLLGPSTERTKRTLGSGAVVKRGPSPFFKPFGSEFNLFGGGATEFTARCSRWAREGGGEMLYNKNMSLKHNDRQAERVPVDAFVKVSDNGQEMVFRTRDLSETGLFLYTKVARAYPFKVGSTLRLELYDFDRYVRCQVVVIRVVEPGSAESEAYPTGFGVRIISVEQADPSALRSLVSRARDGLL
jgi:hypothetical protein